MSQSINNRFYLGKARQQGLSLIELMVALLITAIIFAGVINTLLASKRAYLFDDEIAYIQENSRFALDFLAREVREAGYTGGCNINAADVANSLDIDAATVGFYDQPAIKGYEGGVSVFPASIDSVTNPVYATSDAFFVRRMGDEDITITNTTGGNFVVTPSNSFLDSGSGDIIAVSADCSQVTIFDATHGPSATRVQHNQGADGRNCSTYVNGDFDCDGCPADGRCTGYETGTIDPGGRMAKFKSTAFYIKPSSYNADIRSLYVGEINSSGGVNGSELVSGVEDMQILYGIDNEPTNPDGEANRYYTADAILQDNADATTAVAWDRVVSARITLVMRSRNEVLSEASSITMPTTGTTYNDRYLYQEVSTVINLRNAALPANPVN